MRGSVHVQMVYSVRAKLAVRVTAPSARLAAVRGGADAGQHAEPGRTWVRGYTGQDESDQLPAGSAQGGPVKTVQRVIPERPSARTPPVAGRPLGTGSQLAGSGGHAPRVYLRYTFHVLPVDLPDEQARERL